MATKKPDPKPAAKKPPSRTSRAVSFRIPIKLLGKIDAIAAKHDVARNKLVGAVLAEYINERDATVMARVAEGAKHDLDLFA